MYPKCNACVAEFVLAHKDNPDEEARTAAWNATVNDAVTDVPSWQSHTVMGQMIFACVTLPTCQKHLGLKDPTPMEKAAASGLLVPGGSS